MSRIIGTSATVLGAFGLCILNAVLFHYHVEASTDVKLIMVMIISILIGVAAGPLIVLIWMKD